MAEPDGPVRLAAGPGRLLLGISNLAIGLANTFQPTVRLGWINLLCASLLMYALGRIHGKKEALQQKRLLME